MANDLVQITPTTSVVVGDTAVVVPLVSIRKAMGTCVFFNGILHRYCEAGVKYQRLAGFKPGWATRLPCIASSAEVVACKHRKVLTKEQAGAAVLARDFGSPECPVCGGRLRSAPVMNATHVYTACATNGCVQWVEGADGYYKD